MTGHEEWATDKVSMLTAHALGTLTKLADYVQENILDDVSNEIAYSAVQKIKAQTERIEEKVFCPHALQPDLDEQFSGLLAADRYDDDNPTIGKP